MERDRFGAPVWTGAQPLRLRTRAQIGVRNLATLQKLIAHQKLEYDFVYHQLEFEVDSPVVVASAQPSILKVRSVRAESGLLPCTNRALHLWLAQTDCHLRLGPRSSFPAELPAVSNQQLNEWRLLLSTAKELRFELGEGVNAAVEADFITMRQENPTIHQGDLHLGLTLARFVHTGCSRVTQTAENSVPRLSLFNLLSLSHLEPSMSVNRWKEALVLLKRNVRSLSLKPTASATV